MTRTDVEPAAATAAAATAGEGFRASLVAGGLLYRAGADGVYGFSPAYQRIVAGIDRLVTGLGGGVFEAVTFPPVLVRSTFDRTGYLESFPDLMGSVQVFRGGEQEHRELCRRYQAGAAWPELLEPAEVVLSSAACHPIYPLCAGQLPPGGRRLEIENWCFRHEPSTDPSRMVAFRMHELVYVGEPDTARSYRGAMLGRGVELLRRLGLPIETVPANDPFFGRVGTILASAQLEDNQKIEGVTPICSESRPTAVISGNCARDHFGGPFGIETHGGEVAHSACVAFGVDRITLALLHRHGLDPDGWPAGVQRLLWP